ncbi:uncharacterized protein [Haliotis asinina]|uniref:uncharacterized protein n=1 Tax=Haliotis asinina TaxID=109174 RepID=UPI0035325182
MAEKGTSVHVTGNQGNAHSVYAIGIHQGTLNVNNSRDEDRLRDLKDQTRKDIDIWNRGMVRVSAIETVIEKLQTRHRWVTVTGNAGDGKTTLGYMVLKYLQDDGKEVFKIDSPEDYFIICRKAPDSVVFMNDVFGPFDFDQRAFSSWLPVFQTISEGRMKGVSNENGPSIIFVSRLNVLKVARNQLGKYGDIALGEVAVVNPDKLNTATEKLDILDFHLSRHNISDIPESIKRKLYCQCPHGFPHCCEMYVELRASGHEIDIVEFFSSPLKFLNYTTSVLIDKQKCCDHFKLLLKAGGQLDISSIRDATLRTEMQRTASGLLGSYLKMSGNGVAFSHPSIYESVAVAVGNKDPLFAAQEFPISVIMQKCKVHVPQEGDHEMYIFFKESSSAMDALVQRLATEIRQGNYAVIQHELCWERKFCEQVIQSSVRKAVPLFVQRGNYVGINQRDHDERTLLNVAVTSRNYTACRILLERGANVNMPIRSDTSLTILHEVVGDVDFLELFLQHGADVEYRTDEGITLLHCCIEWLRGPLCTAMIVLLLRHGAKINKTDGNIKTAIRRATPYFFGDVGYIKLVAYGKTALHYACRKYVVDVDAVSLLIDHGAAVNQVDENGETALHYLCQREDEDERIEIANRNFQDAFQRKPNKSYEVYQADSLAELLEYLCEKNGVDKEELEAIRRSGRHQGTETEEMKTIKLLIEWGAEVDKMNKFRQTALHLLCQRSRVDVRTVHLLIRNGAGVNKADRTGNTPVHYICQRKVADISTLYLLTEHNVSRTLKNRHGFTALQYLCGRQRIRLGVKFHGT